MKNDIGKKLLKVLLVLVIACGALSIIRAFNIEALSNILSIGYMPLGTLNAILFIYAMDKGEKVFSKIGLITIIVDIIIYILELVGIFTTTCIGLDCNYLDQFIYGLDTLCYDLLTLCNYMVILSLLKDNNDKVKMLKQVTLYGSIIYTAAIFILYVTTLYYKVSALVSVVGIIGIIRNTTFAAAIILYLLNKSSISEITSDSTIKEKEPVKEEPKKEEKKEEKEETPTAPVEEKKEEQPQETKSEEVKEEPVSEPAVESQPEIAPEPVVEQKPEVTPEPVVEQAPPPVAEATPEPLEPAPVMQQQETTSAPSETTDIETVLASETASNPTGIQSSSNETTDTTPNSVEIQSTSVSDSIQ